MSAAHHRRRVRRLRRHTLVRGFPNRPGENWLQLIIRLIRACQAVRSVDSSRCRLIIGIVAKYAGRVSREPVCHEGVAAVRWYGPDPEIVRRSSVRDVDRLCFHDNVVPLSYKASFSPEHWELSYMRSLPIPIRTESVLYGTIGTKSLLMTVIS